MEVEATGGVADNFSRDEEEQQVFYYQFTTIHRHCTSILYLKESYIIWHTLGLILE